METNAPAHAGDMLHIVHYTDSRTELHRLNVGDETVAAMAYALKHNATLKSFTSLLVNAIYDST